MIQFMRSTSSAAASQAPLLQAGQPFYEIDTHKFKIGDGSTAWNDLPYIGSGKVYAEAVVGSSTNGYTSDQVDYLCDGTDDNIEISEAIGSARTVVILPGTYNCSDSITSRNVVIMGFGPASTTLSFSNGKGLLGATNVSNLKITTSYSNQDMNRYGVRLQNGGVISNCDISGFYYCVDTLSSSDNIVVDSCTIHDWVWEGIRLQGPHSIVRNSRFYNSADSGGSVAVYGWNTQHTQILNNTFNISDGEAIRIDDGAAIVAGNLIQCADDAVDVSEGSVVVGNYIEYTGTSNRTAISGIVKYSCAVGNVTKNYQFGMQDGNSSNTAGAFIGNVVNGDTFAGDIRYRNTNNLVVGNVLTGSVSSGTASNNLIVS